MDAGRVPAQGVEPGPNGIGQPVFCSQNHHVTAWGEAPIRPRQPPCGASRRVLREIGLAQAWIAHHQRQLAPGDATRQSAALASTLAAAQQNPTSGNRLRYAIALGSAGHAGSNPVEGRRLISELLAGQNDLQPQEITLANAYLREFDARVALYAELARQREETERKLLTADADGDRRYNALNAETQRLKKALAEAERKLEAVAEMERALTPESQ